MVKKCQCSRLKRIRTNPDGTTTVNNPTCDLCLPKVINQTVTDNVKVDSVVKPIITKKVRSPLEYGNSKITSDIYEKSP